MPSPAIPGRVVKVPEVGVEVGGKADQFGNTPSAAATGPRYQTEGTESKVAFDRGEQGEGRERVAYPDTPHERVRPSPSTFGNRPDRFALLNHNRTSQGDDDGRDDPGAQGWR